MTTDRRMSHAELIAQAVDHQPADGWFFDAVCTSLAGFDELNDDVCAGCPVRLDCLADVLAVEAELSLVEVALQRGVPASARLAYWRDGHHPRT